MRKNPLLLIGSVLTAALLFANTSWAGHDAMYRVTVTNLTPGQPFAPIMVATHRPGIQYFEEGAAPSDELARLAEAGDGQPMADYLLTLAGVRDAEVSTGGLTLPGDSTTIMVWAKNPNDHVSVGAMLGATNDAFLAIKDMPLPTRKDAPVIYMANAYDAGSETNDESAAHVAGLGGEGYSPEDDGEGFVTIHSGIHGIGALAPEIYDWRNPVARIVIERVGH